MLDGNGKSTNYGIVFSRVCEAARERYLNNAEACDGDEDAISELPVALHTEHAQMIRPARSMQA